MTVKVRAGNGSADGTTVHKVKGGRAVGRLGADNLPTFGRYLWLLPVVGASRIIGSSSEMNIVTAQRIHPQQLCSPPY